MASPNFITHNFAWKLLSLLLAGLVWLTIEANLERHEDLKQTPVVTTSQRTFPAVPLSLTTAVTETNRFRVSPVTVSVELSGNAEDLGRIDSEDIHATVIIMEGDAESRFRKKIAVTAPPGIRVESVTPIYATVEITRDTK